LELIITAGALGLNFVAAIAGLFGMNLYGKLNSDSPIPFITVPASSVYSMQYNVVIGRSFVICAWFVCVLWGH